MPGDQDRRRKTRKLREVIETEKSERSVQDEVRESQE